MLHQLLAHHSRTTHWLARAFLCLSSHGPLTLPTRPRGHPSTSTARGPTAEEAWGPANGGGPGLGLGGWDASVERWGGLPLLPLLPIHSGSL
jgi:hypothetical protein